MSTSDYVALIQVLTPWFLGVLALIQAVTLGLLTLVVKRSKRIKEDVADTKDQVVNHHPQQPNFRDQQDTRHNETRNLFARMMKELKQVERHLSKRLGNVEKLADDLATGFLQNRERIEDIERTQPMRGKMK